MKTSNLKQIRRSRRKIRVRKKIYGTPDRPRLAVHRSLKNLSVQLIDDVAGRTLLQLSTMGKDFKSQVPYGGNVAAAAALGKLLGERAKASGIEQVAFDRAGYRFHGRVKALADGARESGLKL